MDEELKTETEIAKENVKEWRSCYKLDAFRNRMCYQHLTSCKRFLEFLKRIEITHLKFEDCDKCDNKIKDLKSVIKIYKDEGIK